MDIDDVVWGILPNEVSGEHLHVPRQHDEINSVRAEEFELAAFGLRLVLFPHWNHMERDAIEIRPAARVFVVADHQRNFASELAAALSIEQVHQAMVVARNEKCDFRAVARESDAPLH